MQNKALNTVANSGKANGGTSAQGDRGHFPVPAIFRLTFMGLPEHGEGRLGRELFLHIGMETRDPVIPF